MSTLEWSRADDAEMARGTSETYVIFSGSYTAVLTRFASDGTPGSWWVAAQAALNAIQVANPLPRTETEAVLRQYLRDAAQKYEAGLDITGYPRWRRP